MENKLKGKTFIVTGANCGIGYGTALGLAKRGARVILACRDEIKAKQACDNIIETSQNDQVEVELLDLSSLKSIKAFSERIKAKLDRLDVLINNAGLIVEKYSKTEDGFETTWGVNHLGPYYLTRLLLDLIKKSAPSRIINVSSNVHYDIKMKLDDLQFEKSSPFEGWIAYSHSKLANVLFTNELAERLKDSGVTCVSLHPGIVKTDILRMEENDLSLGSGMTQNNLREWVSNTGVTIEQGSATSIYCSTAENVVSGAYYEYKHLIFLLI